MLFKHRISKKVFKQLVAKNVKKSMKDYFIYFFTLTFAVCLFYTFNSIGDQFKTFNIPDTLNYLEAAKGAMAGVSILVCAIVGFLIVYANRFLMNRRKKEFGIYCVLGMERKDISRILMKETIRIGGISLIAGILLGVLFSQGLTMITGKMAGVGLHDYAFVFSPTAILASILFFALTFVFVHFYNIKEVKKMKLIDLLYAEKKNEEIKAQKKQHIFAGFAGVILIAFGYFTVYHWSESKLFESIGLGSTLIGVGTLLLFFTLINTILEHLKKKKRFYYKNLNLFNVNQLKSKIKNTELTAAVVCILVYLSISIMGVGLGLGESSIRKKDTVAPYDISIQYFYYGDELDNHVKQNGMVSTLTELNTEFPSHLKKANEITYYEQADLKVTDVFGKSIQGDRKILKILGESPIEFISIKDYNELLKFQGKEPISLREGEYAISYNAPESKEFLKRYQQEKHTSVNLAGTSLNLKKNGIYQTTLYNRNVLLDFAILIVPEQVAAQGEPELRVLNGMFTKHTPSLTDMLVRDMEKTTTFNYISQQDIHVEILSDNLTASYIGGYLGIVFLVSAGAVLALQHLTQSEDNEKRYALLYKMGAGEQMMKKSLLTQMIFYFGFPFGIAAVHSGVIMAATYRNISYLTRGDIVRNISLAAGLAIILYGIYFITTYSGSKRILKL